MSTSIIIETADSNGKKYQRAIADVDPTKTNFELKTFAINLNALTGNDYVGGTRVERIDLDDEYDPNGGSSNG